MLNFIVIFISGEIIAFFIFKFMNNKLKKEEGLKFDRSVFKGILERLFLFLSLVYYIPQSFIAFGALKIGTRFRKGEDKISNDYFFIGNITSLLLSLLYFIIWKAF
ncbi:MAG: hypothetical protein ACOC5R_03910 [Elusimicrobiota bacterium]